LLPGSTTDKRSLRRCDARWIPLRGHPTPLAKLFWADRRRRLSIDRLLKHTDSRLSREHADGGTFLGRDRHPATIRQWLIRVARSLVANVRIGGEIWQEHEFTIQDSPDTLTEKWIEKGHQGRILTPKSPSMSTTNMRSQGSREKVDRMSHW
jgi:hypothetical protein